MLVLGIDPGFSRLGWGVVSENKNKIEFVDTGCLETSAKDTEQERLRQVFAFVSKILKKYSPDTLSIEQLFFATNAKTAFSVGQARGIVLLSAQLNNIPIASYTPLQIKQAITGYGKADKKQIQQMVKSILKLPTVPQPDDAADALAIALTHLFSYRSKVKFNSQKA